MPEQPLIPLREAVTAAGVNLDTRVDFERGIVYDVVLLGLKSQNFNAEYAETARNDALRVVEQVGSYIDHPAGESNNRSIRENFGRFIGGYKNSAGEVCAREYHYNTKSAFAPEFEWMLKNIPHRIGFSINGEGKGSPRSDGSRLVERIDKVYSFDLVDGPATTNGIWNLRESINRAKTALRIREQTNTMFDQTITTGTQEIADAVKNGTIDKGGAVKAFKNLLKLLGETDSEQENADKFDSAPDGEKEVRAMEGASRSKYPHVKFLALKLDEYKVREQAEKKKAERDRLTAERVEKAKSKLPEEAITLLFREQLAGAKDDATVDALIEDRAKFQLRESKDNTPSSHAPTNSGPVLDKDRLEALKKQYAI